METTERNLWPLPEPTGDQCSSHAVVHDSEFRIGCAIWYPQMGG